MQRWENREQLSFFKHGIFKFSLLKLFFDGGVIHKGVGQIAKISFIGKFHLALYMYFPLPFFWMNCICFFYLFHYILWRVLRVFFPSSFTSPLNHLALLHPASNFLCLMAFFFSLWIAVLNSPQTISSELRVFPLHAMVLFGLGFLGGWYLLGFGFVFFCFSEAKIRIRHGLD